MQLRAVLGEIPAASAGMTEVVCAGMAEVVCTGMTERWGGYDGEVGREWRAEV